VRSLISLPALSNADVSGIVDRAVKLADQPAQPTLSGRSIGIYFRRSSTRTRTAFWKAATNLGADVITFGPEDLQLTTGESLADTARVLACYLDILVVRTNDDIAELHELDRGGDLAIVNALTRLEHPTQALADLVTLQEEFGELSDRHMLYVGEGNSTARALVHATAMTPGLRLTLVTPPGYGLTDADFAAARRLGGGPERIVQHHAVPTVAEPVDAVYTSRWQTMGVSKEDPNWRHAFEPLRVSDELLDRVGDAHTVFLHDLPAIRGQEVTDALLDGPRSRAFRQAYHKMTSAMAVLEWCAATPRP
jgi:ornithine carbamoyltransferase